VRGLAVLVGLAIPLVAEAGLRLAGFRHRRLEPPPILVNAEHDSELYRDDGLHEPSVDSLWRPRPGAAVPWGEGERISPAACRGPAPDLDAELRVLVLGDSVTFGYGVPHEQSYPARLERRLAELDCGPPQDPGAAPRVQVLNGGVIGGSLRQFLARLRELAPGWSPQLVGVCSSGINDHWPAFERDDGAKIAHLRARASTSWLRALRGELRLLQLVDWIAERARGGREALVAAYVERVEARHAANEGYLGQERYLRRVGPEKYRPLLEALESEAERGGAELVLVSAPQRPSVAAELWPITDYPPLVAAWAREAELRYLDGNALFAASWAAGVAEDELFVDRYHLSARGNALVADALFELLEDRVRELMGCGE